MIELVYQVAVVSRWLDAIKLKLLIFYHGRKEGKMKFLAELVQSERGKNTYLLGPIHGPCHDDDDEAVNREIARLSPKKETTRFFILEGRIIEVRPELGKHKTRADVQPIFDDGIRWRLSEGSWWNGLLRLPW